MPMQNWTVLKLAVGQADKLEKIAKDNGLLVEVYSPKLTVKRRFGRKRKPVVVEVEAYSGYAFARGDIDLLFHIPDSKFSFLSFGGERSCVSEDEVAAMVTMEERWRNEAMMKEEGKEIPQFEVGESVILKGALFAGSKALVEKQVKDSVFVSVSGSSVRVKVSCFLLDKIQA